MRRCRRRQDIVTQSTNQLIVTLAAVMSSPPRPMIGVGLHAAHDHVVADGADDLSLTDDRRRNLFSGWAAHRFLLRSAIPAQPVTASTHALIVIPSRLMPAPPPSAHDSAGIRRRRRSPHRSAPCRPSPRILKSGGRRGPPSGRALLGDRSSRRTGRQQVALGPAELRFAASCGAPPHSTSRWWPAPSCRLQETRSTTRVSAGHVAFPVFA